MVQPFAEVRITGGLARATGSNAITRGHPRFLRGGSAYDSLRLSVALSLVWRRILLYPT